jgi:hypothetical protein
MVTARRKNEVHCSPASLGWWCRLLAAVLFAFYVNYLPFHLLTQPHAHDTAESASETALASNERHDPDHDGHKDHHVPHPSSEHLVQMVPKSKSIFVCVVFLPASTRILFAAPEQRLTAPPVERISLREGSSPDLQRSRAPPFA